MNRTFAAAASAPRPPRPDLTNQLADAEAAYALIVERASEWGVDTDRIGMIGFSAGAGLTMHSTLHSKTMELAFIGPIYGGMGPLEVPEDAPPMFNAIATDWSWPSLSPSRPWAPLSTGLESLIRGSDDLAG